MQYVASGLLILAGIIHIIPITGVVGAASLHSLYGVEISDDNLLLLMRHRAILFALLGGFLILAAFKPQFFVAAISAGLISTIAFLVLAWTSPGYNAELTRVVLADIVAIAFLTVAGAIGFLMRTAS